MNHRATRVNRAVRRSMIVSLNPHFVAAIAYFFPAEVANLAAG